MDTSAIRGALDSIDRLLDHADALKFNAGLVELSRHVDVARRALDTAEQETAQSPVSTAEDAFAEILGIVTAMQKTGGLHPAQVDRLIAMVRVGIADLHDRPQGSVELAAPGPEPWHRIRLVELALRWAEIDGGPDRRLLDRARDLEAYVTGSEETADGG